MSHIAVSRLAVAAMLLSVAGAPARADQAVTFTAIALAESGGNTRSTLPPAKIIQRGAGPSANSTGEHSRGLWQINAAARTSLPNVTRTLTPRMTPPRMSMPSISARVR